MSRHTDSALGTVLRTFRPPSRAVALRRALCLGALAAAGWWASAQLAGSWWIALAAPPALALTLAAFSFLLRLAAPGPVVRVHEHGIRFGRRALAFAAIGRIEDAREAAERGGVDHSWEFVLHDGRVRRLHVHEDGSGGYLDTAALEALLLPRVAGYRNLHASAQRALPGAAASAGCGPPRAALPTRKDVLADLREPAPWPRVLDRLRAGEASRRRIARRVWWRWVFAGLGVLALRGLVRGMGLVAFLAALAAVLGAAESLLGGRARLGTLLDLAGLPAGWSVWLILATVAVLVFVMAGRMEDAFRTLHTRAERLRALTNRLGGSTDPATERLVVLDRAGEPFAVHLRSFRAEHFRFRETHADLAELARIEPLTREVDASLALVFERRMPLFTLANVADPTPAPGVLQLYVEDREWAPVADAVIARAALVVVHLAQGVTPSPGLLRELVVLEALGAETRTLMIVGDGAAIGELEAVVACFPHRTSEAAEQIEQELARMPAIVRRAARSSTWGSDVDGHEVER